MPRLRKSVKEKVEHLVSVAISASELSAQHAEISARFAEASKENARRVRIILEQHMRESKLKQIPSERE